MDSLGTRDELVEPLDLTRWNFTKLLEQPKDNADVDDGGTPFPWRNDLNAKIALWFVH